MRTRQLKKLLKELNYTEASSFIQFEDSTSKAPKKPIWFHDRKYWAINTKEGNYFFFDGDFSAYSIGKFNVGIESENDAVEMFLKTIFGTYTATENTLHCEVKDRINFDKWYNAILA
ncbi:MAG: hypothetical protein MSS96_02995 [Bacteroidales bacterium]|nr:hypothetical protein [Bacteroidales bacterium]